MVGPCWELLQPYIATAFAIIIVISLLGLIITLLFMIVKKIKTVHSGDAQCANQITAHAR